MNPNRLFSIYTALQVLSTHMYNFKHLNYFPFITLTFKTWFSNFITGVLVTHFTWHSLAWWL